MAERWHYQHTAGRLYPVSAGQNSGKTRGGRLCIFVNNSWCTISKEVSRFCSPEVEYLMISCRPHYLPREFSSVFFVAVYIPPQTDAGTKTALNELYFAISKQENAHTEQLKVAGCHALTWVFFVFFIVLVRSGCDMGNVCVFCTV